MFFSEKNSPEILYYILFDFTLFHNFSLEKFAFYFQRVSPVSQVMNTVEKNIFFFILDHQKPEIFCYLVF